MYDNGPEWLDTLKKSCSKCIKELKQTLNCFSVRTKHSRFFYLVFFFLWILVLYGGGGIWDVIFVFDNVYFSFHQNKFFILRKPFTVTRVCQDYPKSSGHVRTSDLDHENMLGGILYSQHGLCYFSSSNIIVRNNSSPW